MRSILLAALLTVLGATAALAQVPRTVSFQGRARDASGAYPDNVRRVTVAIFDAATGGERLFTETHSINFENGAFTVIIGGTTGGIPEDVDFTQPLWLSLTIEGLNSGAPLDPRLRFHSAPTAMTSSYAEFAETADEANSLVPGAQIQVTHLLASDSIGSEGTPTAGALYKDNLPIAWALISADGEIITDFGIESVAHAGDGSYEILLDNGAVMVEVPKGRTIPALAPMVQPSFLTDTGQPVQAQWAFRPGATHQDRLITVQTFVTPNQSPQFVDCAFSIVVFGRPAN